MKYQICLPNPFLADPVSDEQELKRTRLGGPGHVEVPFSCPQERFALYQCTADYAGHILAGIEKTG